MLEKHVEHRICKHAKSLGFLVYKFTSPQRRSVPDRLFISPDGIVFFMELKAPGGQLTEGQVREINRIRANGVAAFVIDNPDYGKHIIDMIDLGLDPVTLVNHADT